MSSLIISRPPRKRPSVDIVPLIDVMCYLVFFFMLFSSLSGPTEGIPVSLPKASTGEEQVASEIYITITNQGSYYFNDKLVSLLGLESEVRDVVELNPNVVAVFRTDENAYMKWTVDAIDSVRRAGVQALTFEVELEDR
jgi:biopolymer transport protein ExbD